MLPCSYSHNRNHLRRCAPSTALIPSSRISEIAPIVHRCANIVVCCAESPQLHSLTASNLLSAISTVAPLYRYIAVGVGVYEHIKGVRAGIELREEGDAGGDLAEEGGNFGLDFCFGFLGGRSGCCVCCARGGG